MNSIDRNQPEDSRRDLAGTEAIAKMKELVDAAETCFFCTRKSAADSVGARPMAVQEVDERGHLWFLSAQDSHKNEDLERNPAVRLYFQAASHSDFLVLDGNASVSQDRDRINELWKPVLRTWFTEGQNDPRLTVIEVSPDEGYYWDTKHGMAVAGIKMLLGAALGRTMDDSVEGQLRM